MYRPPLLNVLMPYPCRKKMNGDQAYLLITDARGTSAVELPAATGVCVSVWDLFERPGVGRMYLARCGV